MVRVRGTTEPDIATSNYDLASQQAFYTMLTTLSPIELAPGDVLVRQGEASDAAYFLEHGEMLALAETAHGPTTLATLHAPRLIGEIGALANLPRTASLRAATSARLFKIERAQLLALGQNCPAVLLSAVEQMGRHIASVNAALALYTNALAALQENSLDSHILDELNDPPASLAAFSKTFRRFAKEITDKRRRQDEMAVAGLLQQSLLPKDVDFNRTRQNVEIVAALRPAREVGGDFYDFFMLDAHRLAIAVGDVCGKGIPAGLFATLVMTVLRMTARDKGDVAAILETTNARLCEDNSASMFATLFFGILDLRSGEMQYSNCGHVAPLYIPTNRQLRQLSTTGMPLAIDSARSAAVGRIMLSPGDTLVIITDGVTEAMNPDNEGFGYARFLEALRPAAPAAPQELLSVVLSEVDRFSQGEPQADDIAFLGLKLRSI